MRTLRRRPAFRARFEGDFVGALEGTRLFEAPMTTLFHVRAPESGDRWKRRALYRPAQRRGTAHAGRRDWVRCAVMADAFDPAAMISRFQERARAVRSRGVPPIEGPERKRFVERMELDFMDFAMLGDATAELTDGVLTLRIDLRPPPAQA